VPVLNLHDNIAVNTQQIASIMLYPDCLRSRKIFLISFKHEENIDLLKRGIMQVNDPIKYAKFIKNNRSPKEHIEEAAKTIKFAASLTGAILLLVLGTDPQISSINLAIQSIEKEYKNKKTQISRRSLETSWQQYRSVAHLWAAHQIWISKGAIRDMTILDGFPCHPTQLKEFLGFAEYLRRNAESFKLPRDRQGRYLLDKNRTWHIRPASFAHRYNNANFLFNSNYYMLDAPLKERKIYGKK